ncbi:checkpoint protein Hus1/Mec3 [Panaeolus papilionaceus]|nr:checkpoint protein Hus1/Mec3 [Panaeolus papilionaceus]
MRFRAEIIDVQNFSRIIQTVEKLQKRCIIKFTETTMQIICNNESNEGGIQLWSKIKVNSLFEAYRIQSNANNEITVSISTEALLGALRSAASSVQSAVEHESFVMKLAKKQEHAVFSFEISGQSRVGNRLNIAHDVKIEVLRPADVAKMTEPLCPEPDVHILLPRLEDLRTIVERLRPLSDIISIRGNNNHKLQLAIHTDSVQIETEWTDLHNPVDQGNNEEGEEEEPRDPDQIFKVTISTRSFLKFLNSHAVSTTTIGCLCQNHCLILYVYIGDVADAGGVLTFYIPAIIDDEQQW